MMHAIPRPPLGLKALTALLFTFAAALMLAACLSNGPTETAAEEDLSAGAKLLKKGRCAEAMAAFEEAIAGDSTLSEAYAGYATATACYYDVDTAEIRAEFEAVASDTALDIFALLDHPDSVLTKRLQATGRIRKVFARLTDRDTLTRFWRYLDDKVTTAESEDDLYDERRAVMQQYFVNAGLGMPGYRPISQFPLTDAKVTYDDYSYAYVGAELLYAITRLYDLDQNDTIDARDELMKKLKFGNSDGFDLDSLSNIAGDLETDTALANNLNELIRNLGRDSSGALLQLILPPNPDSSVSGGGDSTDIDSVIASFGDAILFYQFGDKLDNDGDGCIDEEVMDEKDNDLDGYVDEDARVIPADKPDYVDNDHNGRQDPFHVSSNPVNYDSLEGPAGATAYPAKPHVLGFVHKYLAANSELGAQDAATTWVKIKKPLEANIDDNLRLRLAIQKDSLALKTSTQLAGAFKPKLDSAKALVGGCWRNYP